MSTPEKPRPSLDDTLARIDEAIEEPHPTSPPASYVVGAQWRVRAQALDSAAALGVPGHRRSCLHDGPAGPDCPGCAAIDALQPPRPGWLARALNRLFG